MKITTLTTGIAVVAVGATMTMAGPAIARHGDDDRGGDDRGSHRGDDRGSDDRGSDDRGGRDDRGGDDPGGDDRGGDDRRVIRSGACDGSARWKLKAKDEDGGIEWEFEVDSNRTGQTWQVLVARDGDRVFSGRRTTTGRSGSFSVERTVRDTPGSDTFVAVAAHGDQTCRGSVRY